MGVVKTAVKGMLLLPVGFGCCCGPVVTPTNVCARMAAAVLRRETAIHGPESC